jgi:hypothetical protein
MGDRPELPADVDEIGRGAHRVTDGWHHVTAERVAVAEALGERIAEQASGAGRGLEIPRRGGSGGGVGRGVVARRRP